MRPVSSPTAKPVKIVAGQRLPLSDSVVRRLQSAVLPDGDIVRLVSGLYCPCGRVLRCDPEPMGDGGFRLLCDGCHGDVMDYEPGPLIAGTFPIYESQIPPASRNAVTRSSSQMLAALHRLSAVCNAEPPPLVALSWHSEGRLCVFLARQPDDGSDTIDAQATGAARTAVPLRQIVGLIGNFDCESLRLEAGAEGPLVIIGEAKLALIMRVAWNFEREVP